MAELLSNAKVLYKEPRVPPTRRTGFLWPFHKSVAPLLPTIEIFLKINLSNKERALK
jgi:hypothetical protein